MVLQEELDMRKGGKGGRLLRPAEAGLAMTAGEVGEGSEGTKRRRDEGTKG